MSEKFIPCYHRSAGDNLPIIRLVVHATCPGMRYPQAAQAGEAVDTARYFQSPGSGGSAHHVADDATTVRCATDDTICWHAPPNPHTLGYEVGGEVSYTRAQWLSPQVWPAVKRAAALIKADAAKHAIPIRRLTVAQVKADVHGICGHVDVSQAFHQSDHTDPGPNFPWDMFMALLVAVPSAKTSVVAKAKIAVKRPRCAPKPPTWYHDPLVYTAGKPLMHGADVLHVQKQLVAAKFLASHNAKGESNTDGFYGPSSKAAVQACQRQHHINPDGVVGPDTARAIG